MSVLADRVTTITPPSDVHNKTNRPSWRVPVIASATLTSSEPTSTVSASLSSRVRFTPFLRTARAYSMHVLAISP